MTTRLRIAAIVLLCAAAPAFAGGDHDATTHYNAGKKAFDDGDFPKAIEELKASIAAKPTAKAYLLLGNTQTKAGDLAAAKLAFEEFLKADPKSSKKRTVENLIRELGVLDKTKILVTSTPPGATVYLDLRAEGPRGKTPVEIAATPGQHRLMFDLEGYETGVANVTAVESKSIPVTVALNAKGCDVTVDTHPAGGTFQIDGQASTPAPATVRVSSGKHKLTAGGPGFEPAQKDITCEGTKPMKASINLVAARVGVLTLRAPKGARVSVDGKEVAETAAARLELTIGEHPIDVEEEGKAPWHVVAQIRGGEKLELAPRLDVGGGATGIEVTADPPDAEIRVDGKAGHSGKSVSVAPGDHTVQVAAAGHKPMSRTIAIVAGERAHVEARLEPRGHALLFVGLGATALAAAAEVVAVVGHVRASDELAGSKAFSRWQATEIGGQVAAGTLAAVAIAGFVGYLIQARSSGFSDEAPRTRVGASLTPNGGALVLTRSF